MTGARVARYGSGTTRWRVRPGRQARIAAVVAVKRTPWEKQ